VLRVSEERLVSVAYFRSGYSPLDYPSEAEWEARGMIEQSTVSSLGSLARCTRRYAMTPSRTPCLSS